MDSEGAVEAVLLGVRLDAKLRATLGAALMALLGSGVSRSRDELPGRSRSGCIVCVDCGTWVCLGSSGREMLLPDWLRDR